MKKLLACVTPLLLPALASAQFLDARNRAMGGTGVASSHYASAGFINPALLARSGENDGFGLILPSISLGFADKDGLLEAIDNLQDIVNQAGAVFDDTAATDGAKFAAAITVNDRLQKLAGKQATTGFGFGFSFAMPSSDGWSWAIVASSNVNGQASVRVDPGDQGRLLAPDPLNPGELLIKNSSDLEGAILSEGVLLGAGVTEVGVALATSFDLGGMKLAVGATPKVQRIDTYNYSINVNNFDDNDFDDSRYRNDSTEFNIDVGAALMVTDAFTVGLAARNLIEHEIDTAITNGSQFVSNHISPMITLGAAVDLGGLMVTADIDITEQERFKTKPGPTLTALLDDESRMFRIGAEYDLAGWLQVRAGGTTDLEDTVGDFFTAGVGISPGNLVHIDLTGAIGEGDTYGGALQLWFTF